MAILNTNEKIDNELAILKELALVKKENVNDWIDKGNKKSRRIKQIKELRDALGKDKKKDEKKDEKQDTLINNDPSKATDPLDYFVDANNYGYFWISPDDKLNFDEVKKHFSAETIKLLQSETNNSILVETKKDFAIFHIKLCRDMYNFIKEYKRRINREKKESIRKLVMVLFASNKFYNLVWPNLNSIDPEILKVLNDIPTNESENIDWTKIQYYSSTEQVVDISNETDPETEPSQDAFDLFDNNPPGSNKPGEGIRNINGGSLDVDNYSVRDILSTKEIWQKLTIYLSANNSVGNDSAIAYRDFTELLDILLKRKEINKKLYKDFLKKWKKR